MTTFSVGEEVLCDPAEHRGLHGVIDECGPSGKTYVVKTDSGKNVSFMWCSLQRGNTWDVELGLRNQAEEDAAYAAEVKS